MIKQLVFFSGRFVQGKHSSIQGRKQEVALKRIIKQAAKKEDVLSILSVHGDVTFEACLADSAPEGVEVSRLSRGLRNFRSKPRFDLLFYSLPQDLVDTDRLLEDLCYCRMLLRPGAFLFLVTDRDRAALAKDSFFGNRREEASWLRRAGYVNITAEKRGGRVLLSGQRPWQQY